uniref:Sulfotransferase family protein n=1 Tax=Solibacter usitatus (strain Ellin6076) TaxID=234267 RepID=Q022R1_SOLUE
MMLCKVTRELGFCLIYKNASSSVRAARPMRPVTLAEFLALPRRVALLREPHDRFESTWRDYRQRRDVRLTFLQFAEAALEGCFPFKTPELVPQVEYSALANHLIRWDFVELAGILGVPVPHVNQTEHESVIWPAPVREKFAARYAADLELWGTRSSQPLLMNSKH